MKIYSAKQLPIHISLNHPHNIPDVAQIIAGNRSELDMDLNTRICRPKDVLNNKRILKILSKLLSEALPEENMAAFKHYLKYSTKIIILEYLCNLKYNILKRANISYMENIVPLGFILFKESNNYNEVTLLAANLKVKKELCLRGIGTYLLNKVKQYNRKIYLYSDPGSLNFYRNRDFKNLIGKKKRLLEGSSDSDDDDDSGKSMIDIPDIIPLMKDFNFVDKNIDYDEEFVIFHIIKDLPQLFCWDNSKLLQQ